MAPAQVFSCECCEFFMKSFFYRTPPVAAFMSSIRKRSRGKGGTKERRKPFKRRKENKKISFDLYQQVLAPKKKCKYNYVNDRTAHPLSLTFFFNFFFIWFLACYFFLCFQKYILSHLLPHSEAGIESSSVKQLFCKILLMSLIFYFF